MPISDIPDDERDAYQSSRLARASNSGGALDAFSSGAMDDVVSGGRQVRYMQQPTGELVGIAPPSGAPAFIQRPGSNYIEDPDTGEPYTPDPTSPNGYTGAYDNANQTVTRTGDVVAKVPGYGTRVLGRDPVKDAQAQDKADAAALADQYRAEGRPFYISKVDGMPRPKDAPGIWEAKQAALADKADEKARVLPIAQELKANRALLADPDLGVGKITDAKRAKMQAEIDNADASVRALAANAKGLKGKAAMDYQATPDELAAVASDPNAAPLLARKQQLQQTMAAADSAAQKKHDLKAKLADLQLQKDNPDEYAKRQLARVKDAPADEIPGIIDELSTSAKAKAASAAQSAAALNQQQNQFHADIADIDTQQQTQAAHGLTAAQMQKFAVAREAVQQRQQTWQAANKGLIDGVNTQAQMAKQDATLATAAAQVHDQKRATDRMNVIDAMSRDPDTAPIAKQMLNLDAQYQQRIAKWKDTYPNPEYPEAAAGYQAIDAEFKKRNDDLGAKYQEVVGKKAPEKVGEGELPPAEGLAASFFRPIVHHLAPALGAALGGVLGGAAGGTVGLAGGPAAIGGAIAGDLAGGAAGQSLIQGAQNMILGKDYTARNAAQEEANQKANPFTAGIGRMIGELPAVLGGGVIKEVKLAGEVVAPLTRGQRVINEATSFGRMGAGGSAAAVATDAPEVQGKTAAEKAQFIVDSIAKNSVAGAAMGTFKPVAETFLASVLKKAPRDAAVMAVANNMYDAAFHGKPFDPVKVAKDFGSDAPAFMVLAWLGHAGGMAMGSHGGVDAKDDITAPLSEPAKDASGKLLPDHLSEENQAAAKSAVDNWNPDPATLPKQFQAETDKNGVEIPSPLDPKTAAEVILRIAKGEDPKTMDSDLELKNVGLKRNDSGKIVQDKDFGAPFVTMEPDTKGELQPVITDSGMAFLKTDEQIQPAMSAIGLKPSERRQQINGTLPKDEPKPTSKQTGSSKGGDGGPSKDDGSTVDAKSGKAKEAPKDSSAKQAPVSKEAPPEPPAADSEPPTRPELGHAPPELQRSIGKGNKGPSARAEFAHVRDTDAFAYDAQHKIARGNNVSESTRTTALRDAANMLKRVSDHTGLDEATLRPILRAYNEHVRELGKATKPGEAFHAPTIKEFIESHPYEGKRVSVDGKNGTIGKQGAFKSGEKLNQIVVHMDDGVTTRAVDAKKLKAPVEDVKETPLHKAYADAVAASPTLDPKDRGAGRTIAESMQKWGPLFEKAGFKIRLADVPNSGIAYDPASKSVIIDPVRFSQDLAKSDDPSNPKQSKDAMDKRLAAIMREELLHGLIRVHLKDAPLKWWTELSKTDAGRAIQKASMDAYDLALTSKGKKAIDRGDSVQSDEFARQLFQKKFWDESGITELAGKDPEVKSTLHKIITALLDALNSIREAAPKVVLDEIDGAEKMLRAKLEELGELEKKPEKPALKTKLDLLLDGVERTGKELTIEVTDANRDNLTKIIETAEKRGMHASTDGRFVLIRQSAPAKEVVESKDVRIREDLPEAQPIKDEIDKLAKIAEDRHTELGPDMKGLIHPSELLTTDEKTKMHDLKMSLRPKSREEAKADIMAKRAARLAEKKNAPLSAPENTDINDAVERIEGFHKDELDHESWPEDLKAEAEERLNHLDGDQELPQDWYPADVKAKAERYQEIEPEILNGDTESDEYAALDDEYESLSKDLKKWADSKAAKSAALDPLLPEVRQRVESAKQQIEATGRFKWNAKAKAFDDVGDEMQVRYAAPNIVEPANDSPEEVTRAAKINETAHADTEDLRATMDKFLGADKNVQQFDPHKINLNPEDEARAMQHAAEGGPDWASKVDITNPIGLFRRKDGELQAYDGAHRTIAARMRGEMVHGRVAGEGVLRSPENVSPEDDKAYMHAAESGDHATAQKMVDEAAKKAGLIKGFRAENSGRGVMTDAIQGGIYFFPKRETAELWAGDKGSVSASYIEPRTLKDVHEYEGSLTRGISGKNANGLEGIDADTIIRRHPGNGTIAEIVAFDPSQIKSADPITRDDQGQIIPLSERFNPASNDIRQASGNLTNDELGKKDTPLSPDFPRQEIWDESVAHAEANPGKFGSGKALEGTDSPERRRIAFIHWYDNQDATRMNVKEATRRAEEAMRDPIQQRALIDLIQDSAEKGRLLTPSEKFAWKVLKPTLYQKAVATNSRNLFNIHDNTALAYSQTQTEWARAGVASHDPEQSPAQRIRGVIADIARIPTRAALIRKIQALPTEGAKQRKIKGITRKLADALTAAKTDSETIRSLQRELATARRSASQSDAIARHSVEMGQKVEGVMNKLGFNEYDVQLENADRVAAMKSEPVKQAMAGMSAQDQRIAEMLMQGNSHREVLKKTGRPMDQIAALHEDFRNKLEAQLRTFLGPKGGSLRDMIDQGHAAIEGRLGAQKNVKGDLGQQHVIQAMSKANQAAIQKALSWLMPTAKMVNSGKLKKVEVIVGSKGNKVIIHVPYDPENQAQAMRLTRELSSAQSTKYDKVHEAWIMGILSGPVTQFANVAGNLVSTSWHYGYQRPVEGLFNLVMRDPDGVQMGEFKHLRNGLMPGLREAFTNAMQAFSTETDVVAPRYLNEPLTISAKDGVIDKMGGSKGAIGGNVGRTIRVPGRLLMAMDAFFKTAIARMEVGALAYREGVKKGLSGTALESHVHNETTTYGSESWKKAVSEAEMLTFQNDSWLSKAGEAMVRGKGADYFNKEAQKLHAAGRHTEAAEAEAHADKLDMVSKVLAYLFPFVRTPANIMLMGARKSPIGSLGVLARIASGLYKRGVNGEPFFSNYPQATLAKHLVEQAAAWGAMGVLWGMTEGDDDDSKKTVLLVGGKAYDPSKRAELDFRKRTYGGDYGIIIRDNEGKEISRVAWGRYEPIATALGLLVDGIRSIKEMQKSKAVGAIKGADPADAVTAMASGFMAQIEQKSYLQGIADLSKTMQDIKSGKVTGAELGKRASNSILMSLVPNIIRQPIRNWDDTMRDSRNKSETWYPAWPVAQGAEPMMDVYGREVGKDGSAAARLLMPFPNAPVDAAPADEIIHAWVRNNPDEKDAHYFAPVDKADYYVLDGKKKIPVTQPKQRALLEQRAGQLFLKKSNAIAAKLPRPMWQDPPKAVVDELQKAKSEAWRTARTQLGQRGILDALTSR